MSDRQAFRAIYETHHAAICTVLRAPRDEVEDLAAETFVCTAAARAPAAQVGPVELLEDVFEFRILPDTPENRQLLELK